MAKVASINCNSSQEATRPDQARHPPFDSWSRLSCFWLSEICQEAKRQHCEQSQEVRAGAAFPSATSSSCIWIKVEVERKTTNNFALQAARSTNNCQGSQSQFQIRVQQALKSKKGAAQHKDICSHSKPEICLTIVCCCSWWWWWWWGVTRLNVRLSQPSERALGGALSTFSYPCRVVARSQSDVAQ